MHGLVRTLSVVFISCIKINFKLFQIFLKWRLGRFLIVHSELRTSHYYTILKMFLCLCAPAGVRELPILKEVTVQSPLPL